MTNLSDADLAEIEAVAKAADSQRRWKLLDHSHLEAGCRCLSCHDPATVWQTSNMLDCEDVPRTSDEQERCETAGYTFADAAHIARMDPATTLALLAWGKRAEDAVARVREVHVESSGGDPYGDYIDHRACRHCRKAWPCPTVAALDADAAAGDAG